MKKVGLVLGSGGARGLAHLGVIKCLEENGIEISAIAGSSSGALFGGMYAALQDIKKVEQIALGFQYKDWVRVFGDLVWGSGLLKGKNAETYLSEKIGNVKIEDLKIPFAAVATDIQTGDPVVMKTGSLVEVIRASSSLPFLFEPYKRDGKYLVDGGVSWPVPVEAMADFKVDLVVAVNLDSVYFLPQNRVEKINKLSVITNSFFLLRYHLADKEVRDADLVINPEIPYVMDLAFVGGDKIVEGGYKAMEKQLAELRRLIAN